MPLLAHILRKRCSVFHGSQIETSSQSKQLPVSGRLFILDKQISCCSWMQAPEGGKKDRLSGYFAVWWYCSIVLIPRNLPVNTELATSGPNASELGELNLAVVFTLNLFNKSWHNRVQHHFSSKEKLNRLLESD